MSNYIDVNFIDENDLANVDYKGRSVILDPDAIIYSGYQKRYSDVDTLKWYNPWMGSKKQKSFKKRTLFYGSFQHTRIYTGGPNSDEPGNGPIYRFWPNRALKLWCFNWTNSQEAIDFFISQNGLTIAMSIIYAYGFLYNNIDQSLQLVRYLQDYYGKFAHQQKTSSDINSTVLKPSVAILSLNELQERLTRFAKECENDCQTPYVNGERRDALQVKEYCYDQCWFEPTDFGVSEQHKTSGIKRINRKSFYGIDKPLIECLTEYLTRKGYDGIFAWNQPEHEYVPWTYHDIIIFDSAETLESDNVDVNNDCPNPELRLCPKLRVPLTIPLKRLSTGVVFDRRTQENQFKKFNDEVTTCFDRTRKPFALERKERKGVLEPLLTKEPDDSEIEHISEYSDYDSAEISDEPHRK